MGKIRKFISAIISIAAIAVVVPFPAGSAQFEKTTNIEHQNYRFNSYYFWNWSSPVKSYLTPLEDGGLMRFESMGDDTDYVVEYYDSSYELKAEKTIECELPLFGGFYSSENRYYIVTGQYNGEESAEVECFRITEYDKDWQRLSSAGLYDCNTTVPFFAGSVRMTESGGYLLIRTSHEMYKAVDGFNHQANVTIQYDMNSSSITDSYTDIMNSSYGYVSHSFNQFIKAENDHIIALDHGDAHPRAVVLIRYRTNISSGKFVPLYGNGCIVTDMISFPGDTGDNYTGATVGGFEISDSSYIAAGSIVDLSNYEKDTLRDIFVSCVSKSDGSVTTNMITNYENEAISASTPHLVKISGDKFILLWSTFDKYNKMTGDVYYVGLDGGGNQTTEIRSFKGFLSDCAPVVTEKGIVWYTWNQSSTVFYEINPDDMSANIVKLLSPGDADGNGKVDSDDVIAVLRSITGWDFVLYDKAADLNKDGIVDSRDAIILIRRLSGWTDVT